MATDRQLLFVFKDRYAARIFVRKLVDDMKLEYLAIFIDDEAVIVIDGHPELFRRDRICSAARSSGSIDKVSRS